jgi:hypothetical protein
VRISSRLGWKNQPTRERPDTLVQSHLDHHFSLARRGGLYIFAGGSFSAATSSTASSLTDSTFKRGSASGAGQGKSSDSSSVIRIRSQSTAENTWKARREPARLTRDNGI